MKDLQIVKFYQDELVVLEDEGKKLVALKPIVENLGLDWDGQRKRVNRDPVLSKGAVIMTAPSKGGLQDTLFLELGLLTLYLAKINASRVNKQLRPKLILYQTEVAEVLLKYFTGQLQTKPEPPTDELDILQGAINVLKEVRGKVNKLEEGQEQLAIRLDNTPIRSDGVKRTKVHQRIKQYAIVKGNAPVHFRQAHRRLRTYFDITAFDDIPLRRYDEAMSVLQAWIDEEEYQRNMQGELYEQNGAANEEFQKVDSLN